MRRPHSKGSNQVRQASPLRVPTEFLLFAILHRADRGGKRPV